MIQTKLLKADLHGAIISGNFFESIWSSGDALSGSGVCAAVFSLSFICRQLGIPEVSPSHKQ